ncbi:MAG: N-acetyl-alpha-D-glucosaminyl L-malate synthase BshA [bacterium]|nr:N-acetyl-alpha-D-glucosaminyl L-malate synthase BshA [bacterium]
MSEKKKLRIGVSCYPTYGGSGVLATELGMEMARRGHEIHFITYQFPHRLALFSPNIFYHEVEQFEYPLFEFYPYSMALASKMVEVTQQQSLDLLHVHYAIPHSISALLAGEILKNKLPYITTLHGTDITLVGNDPSFLPVVKLGVDRSPGVTAVSNFLANETRKSFQVQRPIEVIYNFVDGDIFKPLGETAKQVHSFARDIPLIAHLSNFRAVKRIIDVVEVFHRIRQKRDARLLLIGDGPERSRAEHLLQEYGIFRDTIFVGKQLAIPELIALADLFLLPSETESFGLAALEAMCCEVPVLAYRVGGLPEVIESGVTGFLLDLGDIDSMAEAGIELLEQPERRQAMGKAGRIHSLSHFGKKEIVDQYEAFYYQTV